MVLIIGRLMARFNGILFYKQKVAAGTRNEKGFLVSGGYTNWINAGPCHIRKIIPAKQISGENGILINYSHQVFLPKETSIQLSVGTPIQLVWDSGEKVEASVLGYDPNGHEHKALWA
jgi:hypothetical protein